MPRKIKVGNIEIGGGSPVTVQSMTTTATSDINRTAAQIISITEAGCDIVRVAVPDMASADAIGSIKERITIPLVADIHFDHKLALRAAEAGADKIRINPGNIGRAANVRAVAEICAAKSIPIRIGVNSGSLSRNILEKHGGVTPEAMYDSAMEHIRLLNNFDFDDICVSVKTSSVPLTVASFRLLRERTDYPLHIGVTEAGTEYMGIIKSAIGIGTLLSEGIGDTIRVSLTAPPEHEVKAAIAILKSLGLRKGYELISCPTCGRCKVDLIPIAQEVERHLNMFERQPNPVARQIAVAVMGCAVNGPGEASRADYGIALGDNEGVIFKKGNIIGKAPAKNLTDTLLKIITEDINP